MGITTHQGKPTGSSPRQAPRPVESLEKTFKPSRKSTRGGGGHAAKCTCKLNRGLVRESIQLGLRLIRTRFHVSESELPDLDRKDLDKYLLSLLGGPNRLPTPFPRVQSGWSEEGLPNFRRLGRLQRWSLAQSCAFIKKGIPNLACRAHRPESSKPAWMSSQCPSSPPVSTPEYLEFARKITRRTFSWGWDRSLYPSFCDTHAPRSSIRADRSSATRWWTRHGWFRYQNMILNGRDLDLQGLNFRFSEVPTAGKMRPMGIPTQDWDLLAPLHKSMYQHIAKEEWLMCGPPTEERIRKVAGDFNTSVDLVSATDNLRLDVAEAILGVVLSRSAKVPGPIRLLAAQAMRPSMDGVEVTHGQMMGTYLSFPLLCMQSYIAARWATRDQRGSKYLVNGDDVVIGSYHRFVTAGDYPEGSLLNDKKTIRSGNVIELNSTVFLRNGSKWKEVRPLRRGAYNNTYEGIQHISSACVKAGEEWVSAYFRCRVGYSWRLLPSQLGFSLTNRDAFGRESRLKSGLHCPSLPVVNSCAKSYRLVRESEIADDERIAFRIHLLDFGREVSPSSLCWTLSDARKTFVRPANRFGPLRLRTFNRASEKLMEKKQRKEKYLCVPLAYEPRCDYKSCIREVEEGERALTWW